MLQSLDFDARKIARTGLSVSNKDIFEAIDQVRSKKKQLPHVKDIFNYLTKIEKIGNVSLDYLSKRIMNLEKEGKIVNIMFNGTDSFYVAERSSNTIYGINTPAL